jgi:hypothetical protein
MLAVVEERRRRSELHENFPLYGRTELGEARPFWDSATLAAPNVMASWPSELITKHLPFTRLPRHIAHWQQGHRNLQH